MHFKRLGNISIYLHRLTLAHRGQLQYTETKMTLFSSFPLSFYSHKHYLAFELYKNVFISSSKALEELFKFGRAKPLRFVSSSHVENSFNFCAPAWLKAIAWNFNSGDFQSHAGGQSWNCSTFLSLRFAVVSQAGATGRSRGTEVWSADSTYQLWTAHQSCKTTKKVLLRRVSPYFAMEISQTFRNNKRSSFVLYQVHISHRTTTSLVLLTTH